MGFLQDMVGRMSSDFTQNVNSAVRNVGTGFNGFKNSSINSVVNSAKGLEQQFIGTGVSGVSRAASDLLSGNFQNVIPDITQIGSGSLNVLSSALTGPTSGISVTSSDNGIQEGNALYGILNRSDPMLNINWYALMPVIGGTGLAWYYVEKAGIVFREYDTVPIFKDGRTVKYPSKYSLQDLQLDIYMDQANVALNYLTAWNQAITMPVSSNTYYTASGEFGRPINYKQSIFIYLLDNSRNAIDVIEYVGAWPSSIQTLNLESGTAEKLAANVTFSITDVLITNYQTRSSITNQLINSINPARSIQELVSGVAGPVFKSVENSVSNGINGVINNGFSVSLSSAKNFISSFF